MRASIVKHSAALCCCLCLLILISSYSFLRVSSKAGTYNIKHISGDPSILMNLTAHMNLEDTSHVQHITLTQGRLQHSFKYKMPIVNHRGVSYLISQEFVEHEDAEVNLNFHTELIESSKTHDYSVSYMRRSADKARVSVGLRRDQVPSIFSSKVSHESVQVVTDITVENKSKPFVFNYQRDIYEYHNPIEEPEGMKNKDASKDSGLPYVYRGMTGEMEDYDGENRYNTALYAEWEGRVYFTPALRPYHGGQSAIYRVDEWQKEQHIYTTEPVEMDGFACFPPLASLPMGQVTPIVTFPLDGHEFRTVSLDIIDEKILLLLIVDDMLTLRVYHMEGQLLYELQLFRLSSQRDIISVRYANKSGDNRIIIYHLLDNIPYDPDAAVQPVPDDLLFSIELGNEAILRSLITGHASLNCGVFVDGRWVLLEYSRDTSQSDLRPAYAPVYHQLSVLDDHGETLYSGEISTDAAEDYIQYYFSTGTHWQRDGTNYTLHRWLFCDPESITWR